MDLLTRQPTMRRAYNVDHEATYSQPCQVETYVKSETHSWLGRSGVGVDPTSVELGTEQRQTVRQQQTRPILDTLHEWMTLQRRQVPNGSATAKALDYSLRRWVALTRFADDGQLPVDNNWIENQIRPIAIGRNNWLFAGSLRAGQRAAAVMSLIQSARMNGHDPYAYLKDVLTRLPTHKASRIDELLPHRWQPSDA